MNSVVYVPFAASLLLVTASRLLVTRVWPRAALAALAVSAPAVALASVWGLVVLASPLPARLPLVAHLGRWQPTAVATHSPVASWTSALALALLVWIGVRLARALRTLALEAREAVAIARAGRHVTVDDAHPYAHAVGLGVTGRGAVVVSSGLAALLDGDEHAAVVAHERAHLHGRHTLLIALVRVTVALDPLLAPLAADVRYVLERAADESAAPGVGREVLASALAKVALFGPVASATAALGFGGRTVATRVELLLAPADRRGRAALWLLAAAAIATVGALWATHDTERFFEAVRVWSRH